MDSFKKQPYESWTIAVDFSYNMGSGETLISQTVTCRDRTGADATSTILANDGIYGQTVRVRVGAGSENLSPYVITFKAESNITHKWEKDVEMIIEEID